MNNISRPIAVTTFIMIVFICYAYNFRLEIAYFFASISENSTALRAKHTHPQEPCSILLRDRTGRLANRLFMFASALGLALTHSCQFIISPTIIHELNQSFTLHLHHYPFIKSETNASQPHQQRYNHCTYFSQLFDSNTSRFVELTGFWQVHKYFLNFTTQIRHQLQFRSTILDHVNAFLINHFNRTRLIRVAVHIRRGDFVGGRRTSSNQYLFTAMSYFIKKYRSVAFVILTDDKLYAKKLFARRNDVFFTPGTFDAAHDMAVISRCDHAIITVGTYGWWGAFLLHNRTGEVLADAKEDHSPLDVNCTGEDFFPPWFLFLNYTAIQ